MTEVFDFVLNSGVAVFGFYNIDTKEINQYIIDKDSSDFKDMIEHFDKGTLIGYNIEFFNYPLLHYLITSRDIFVGLSPILQLEKLRQKSDELTISSEYIYKKFFTIIDLYKDLSLPKGISLRDAGFAINYKDITGLKFNGNTREEIINYNWNNLGIITNLYYIARGISNNLIYKDNDIIEFRSNLSSRMMRNFMSMNNTMIGYNILISKYCSATGLSIQSVKSMHGTDRGVMKLPIPKFTKFETNKFDSLLSELKKVKVKNGDTKKTFSYSVIYNEIKLDYGLGGLHAANPGIYHNCVEFDINSMYPCLSNYLRAYPEHLGEKFVDIYYNELVKPKLEESKKPMPDYTLMKAYKEAMNSVYGKSNEYESFVYDPKYTMTITIGGEMLISMMLEYVCERIKSKIVYVNTDAICIQTNDNNKAESYVKEFLSKFNLSYKTTEFRTIAIKDVNNFISDKKCIGCFAIDKKIDQDTSCAVIRKAIKCYYIDNTPISQTIKKDSNIYDFCIKLKVNKGTSITECKNDLSKELIPGTIVRYYISKPGSGMYTQKAKTPNVVNKGHGITVFNKYSDWKNIDYNWYIAEAQKLINSIDDGQMNLFNY